MNNIINMQAIDNRVTAMSERCHAAGIALSEDPEFAELVTELMNANEDDLMVLLGSAMAEANALPDWLTQGLKDT
jgi:hypothetical protein